MQADGNEAKLIVSENWKALQRISYELKSISNFGLNCDLPAQS